MYRHSVPDRCLLSMQLPTRFCSFRRFHSQIEPHRDENSSTRTLTRRDRQTLPHHADDTLNFTQPQNSAFLSQATYDIS